MNVNFCWGSSIILRVLRLEVFVYNFYITDLFQAIFAQGGGGEENLLVEMTVNSKEENSQDICPNYVQESGLWCLSASQSKFSLHPDSTIKIEDFNLNDTQSGLRGVNDGQWKVEISPLWGQYIYLLDILSTCITFQSEKCTKQIYNTKWWSWHHTTQNTFVHKKLLYVLYANQCLIKK